MSKVKTNFSNTVLLIKFIAKRELISSVIWLAAILMFTAPLAVLLQDVLGVAGAETMMRNPSMVAMLGPLYPVDNMASYGGIFVNSMLIFTVIPLCIMNIFLVVRNTRADEEKGRAEVIASLPTGRLSNLSATLIVAGVVNFLLAIFCGVSLGIVTFYIDGMTFGGAILYGAALGASGLVFAGIAAVFCQVSQNSSGATYFSMLVLGIFYLIRIPGDIALSSGESGWSAMLSPFGIVTRTQVFVENNPLPIVILLLLAVAFSALSLYLNRIRDLDQGLIGARKGRASAGMLLGSHLGFAFRTVRTSLIVWAFSMFVLGATYGSVLSDIGGFVAGNEMLEAMLGSAEAGTEALTRNFIAMLLSIMTIIAAIPIIGVALRPFNEEKNRRAENILSKVISKNRIVLNYVIVAALASIVMVVSFALGIFCAATPETKGVISLTELLGAAILYLPAVYFMLGLAVLMGGLAPRVASQLLYSILGLSFACLYLSPMIMPDNKWVVKLSPFGVIPKVIVADITAGDWVAVVVVFAIAVVWTAYGILAYRKRDMIS